jgi:hypothetical protein
MLPWSILLLAYAGRTFRRWIGPAEEHVRFLACAIGVALFSCWVLPGARTRHFVSLYPCFAPLIGLVVDRCSSALAGQVDLWRRFLRGMGLLMLPCGLAVVAAAFFGWGPIGDAHCLAPAVIFTVASAVLAGLALWASAGGENFPQLIGVLSVTAFLGLGASGVYRSVLVGLREPIAENLAALKQRLPAGTELVSIGRVDSNFVYYYGAPIRLITPGKSAAPNDADWTYFCVEGNLPWSDRDFPHEDLAVISCKGIHSGRPGLTVAVGRRLPAMGRVVQRPGSAGQR